MPRASEKYGASSQTKCLTQLRKNLYLFKQDLHLIRRAQALTTSGKREIGMAYGLSLSKSGAAALLYRHWVVFVSVYIWYRNQNWMSRDVSRSRDTFLSVSVSPCQCLVSVSDSDLESLGKWSCLDRDMKNFWI